MQKLIPNKYTAGIVFLGILLSCGQSSLTEGEAVFLCDEAVLPAIQRIHQEFAKTYPKAKVNLRYGTTQSVIRRWLDGESSTLLVTRKLDSAETEEAAGQPWSVLKVAMDGLVLIVNQRNPLENIQPAQFEAIFRNEARVWSDLIPEKTSGNDSILVIRDENDSGNKYYFDQLGFLISELVRQEVVRTDERQPASSKIIEAVAAKADAIGVISSAWLTDNTDYLSYAALIRPLEVMPENSGVPVEPHPAYFYRGDYPFRRIIYVYTRTAPQDPAKGLAAYLCGNEGQKMLPPLNLVPLVNPVRLMMEPAEQ